MKNVSLKIWSLIIAILISYFVNSQTNTGLITLIVPVELLNMPANKVVLLPNSTQAKITLRAPSHLLSEIAKSPPSFSLRVPEEIGNRYVVSLQEDTLDLPVGVKVLNIEPAEIEYILDDLIEKTLPVFVPRIGQLQKGYLINSISIQPKEILVTGPKTEMRNLKIIETAPLDLRPLTTNSDNQLPLRLPGRFVNSPTERIKVKVNIEQEQGEKKFNAVPISLMGKEAPKYTVMPKTLRVEVSGPKATIKKLKVSDIQAIVTLPESMPTNESLPITITTPEFISIIDRDPEKATVTLK